MSIPCVDKKITYIQNKYLDSVQHSYPHPAQPHYYTQPFLITTTESRENGLYITLYITNNAT